MLRSVRLAHRHSFDHFAALTVSNDIRLPPRPTLPITFSRWNGMFTAVQFQSRPAWSDPPGPRPVDGVVRSPAVQPVSPQADLQQQIPQEILTMWEDLLLQPDGKRIWRRIRTSPLLLQHLQSSEGVRSLAEAIATSRFPLGSLRVLAFARVLGCTLKQNVYQGVAYQLASRRLWSGVLRVVALGKEHTGVTTSRLLSWRARSLLEMQDFGALDGVLQEYREQNLVPPRRVFHLIISGHIQNRDIGLARQCLLSMSEAGIVPDASTYAIIATYHRALGVDPIIEAQALEALQGLKAYTATNVLNCLIQARLDTQDLGSAVQLLRVFRRDEVVTISSVMSNILDLQIMSGCSVYFPDLEWPPSIRGDLSPNSVTFSIFINYLNTRSHYAAAYQLFEHMTTAGIRPTSFSIVSLINLFVSARQSHIAVLLVAQICSETTPFYMFEPLLSSCHWQDLPRLPTGPSPTIQVFNALFRGLLRTQGLDITKPILRIMRLNGVQPNAVTLGILLNHLSKTERSPPGVLLRVLRKFTSPDLHLTLRHMHLILGCMIRRQKYFTYGRGWRAVAARVSSRARFLISHPDHLFIRLGPSFDPVAGLEMPPAHNHTWLVRDIQSLLERKWMSDSAVSALRIRHDAVLNFNPESAKEVFDVLLSRGMRLNKYHISGLMEGFAQLDDLEGAIDVMKSAEKAGVRPNVVLFTILISACARQGDPGMALQTFQQMVAANVEPDVASIDAVAGAFFAVGRYSLCRRILISFWPYIQPFPEHLREASLETMIGCFRQLAQNCRQFRIPPKEERLALHAKLVELRKEWCSWRHYRH